MDDYWVDDRRFPAPVEWKSPADPLSDWTCRKFVSEEEADRLYFKIVGDSEGFDSFSDSDSEIIGAIRPCPLDDINVKAAADYAIKEYNKKCGDGGDELKLAKIVKGNWQLVCGIMYYITLEAKQQREDKSSFYEAKVYEGLNNFDFVDLEIFRPAKYYKG